MSFDLSQYRRNKPEENSDFSQYRRKVSEEKPKKSFLKKADEVQEEAKKAITSGAINGLLAHTNFASEINKNELSELYSEMIGEPGWEEYLQGRLPSQIAQEAFESTEKGFGGYLPTASEGIRALAEKGGIDIRPTTPLGKFAEKGVAFGTGAGNVAIGVLTPVVSEGLQSLGVPEDVADSISGLAVSSGIGQLSLPATKYAKGTLEAPIAPKGGPTLPGPAETIIEGNRRVPASELPPLIEKPKVSEPLKIEEKLQEPRKGEIIDLGLGEFLTEENLPKSDYALGELINSELSRSPSAPEASPFELQTSVQRTISPTPPINDAQLGRNTTAVATTVKNRLQKHSDELYEHADFLSKGLVEDNPQEIFNEMQELISELSDSIGNIYQEPIRQRMLREARSFNRGLVEPIPEEGRVEGQPNYRFLPVSVDKLVKIKQNLNAAKNWDYDLPGPSGRISQLSDLIDSEIRRIAGEAGDLGEQFLDVYGQANRSWKNLKELTNNSNVKQIYKREGKTGGKTRANVRSFSGDADRLESLTNLLSLDSEGRPIVNQLRSDYAARKLSPWIRNPQDAGKDPNFQRTLDNLETLIPSDQIAAIRDQILQAGKTKKPEAKKALTPTQQANKVKSIEGLKELEQSLPKDKQGQKTLDVVKQTVLRDIIHEGRRNNHIDAPKLLDKVFNDRNKYHLIEELIGEKEAQALQKVIEAVEESGVELKPVHTKILDSLFDPKNMIKLRRGKITPYILGVANDMRKLFLKEKGGEERSSIKAWASLYNDLNEKLSET